MIGLGLGVTHASPLQEATGFADTKAWSFDGVADEINTPVTVDIFNGSGASISFWAKDDAFHNTTKFFINKYQDANNFWQLGFISGFPAFQARDNVTGTTGLFFASQSSGTLTQYNHYCWTFDDSNVTNIRANSKFYINGVAISSFVASMASSGLDNTGNLRLGRPDNAGYTHVDELNEVAFFKDVQLSAAQVAAIYNSGTPFDLRQNQGDYTASSNLEMYIRGEEATGVPIQAVDDSTGNHTIVILGGPVIDSTL